MGHSLFLFAILPGLLLAQFKNLVATDDGSLLLFSSRLQLQGTTEYSWDKLFSFDSSGLQLYEQRQQQAAAPGSRLSNFYLQTCSYQSTPALAQSILPMVGDESCSH